MVNVSSTAGECVVPQQHWRRKEHSAVPYRPTRRQRQSFRRRQRESAAHAAQDCLDVRVLLRDVRAALRLQAVLGRVDGGAGLVKPVLVQPVPPLQERVRTRYVSSANEKL